jgi:hypothetical protein
MTTKKPNLPIVSEDTIKELANTAINDKDALFMKMAVEQPTLYTFIMGVYKMPETNKETMLGLIVAAYSVLDKEIEKGKQSKKRLRHNGI